MMRNLICFFLLLSLLLGGCRPAASPVVATAKATTPPTPKPTAVSLTLKSCTVKGIEAECGSLHVPEDRNNPNGRILDLGIVVVRADGPDRQPDPLFYIIGGPGGYATGDSIVENAHNIIFSKVNAQRDLVFLDQRGTNGKHRLTCEPFPSAITDTTPQEQVDDWMKQCLSSLDGDPRFYTTVPAMQDLDEARAALGYDNINLYGISYGAAAAQVYMRMFPEHVRTAVIDHGTALDLPFYQVFARSSQSALDQVFTYCEQDEKCHAAYPDLRGDLKAVLDRLTKGPVVTSYTPPGRTEPVSLTKIDFEAGIHQLMYTGDYGQIPFIIHTLAANEDWTPIAKRYSEPNPNGSQRDPFLFMKGMIFCFDPAWGWDLGAITRLDPGSYYHEAIVDGAQYWNKVCPDLPKPDPSLIYDPGTPAPLSALMLNSLLDPQNPPSNTDLALKEFTKSRVVVEPTEGHEPNLGSDHSECRLDIITQYIELGSVDGLDTSCLKEIKPSFVIGNE
jgi:pimeloyl-ACP methyl ester carboxylesterase